ncbi:MAG: sigma-70 family RNA polymerase sigma factor [Burkholderiales bacterium]
MSTLVEATDDVNVVAVQWLRDIALGDEGALSSLYDATLGKCYSLAMRITRHREHAEEIVAETYFQVWREAVRFDPDRGRPLTWLMHICYSRAIDHLRRRGPMDVHPDPQTLAEAEPEADDDPLSLALATETHSVLHEEIRRLPRLSQQLLGLAFFRGLTHSEIAEHTGLPLGTVKTHLRQALMTLRATVGEKLP